MGNIFKSSCSTCNMYYESDEYHCCKCKSNWYISSYNKDKIINHCCSCKIIYTDLHCCVCYKKCGESNYDNCLEKYNDVKKIHCPIHHVIYWSYKKFHCCNCGILFDTSDNDNNTLTHCCLCLQIYNNLLSHCCSCGVNYRFKHCCKCRTNYQNGSCKCV